MSKHRNRAESLKYCWELDFSIDLLLAIGVIGVVLTVLSGKYVDQLYRASLTNLYTDITTKKIATALEIATTGHMPDEFTETGAERSQVVVLSAREEANESSDRQTNIFERVRPAILTRSYSTLQKERSIDALTAANIVTTNADSGSPDVSERKQDNAALRQTSLTRIQLTGDMSVKEVFVINGSLYYIIQGGGGVDPEEQNIIGYTLASTTKRKPQTIWYTCSGNDYGQHNYGPVIVSGRFQAIEPNCRPGKYSR